MSSENQDPKSPARGPDLGLAETLHPAAGSPAAGSPAAGSPAASSPTPAPDTAEATTGTEDTVLPTDTLASTAGAPLGERPDADKLVRAVARAKIAGQLFQKQEQVKLGRYHLLETIGAGGMGVVWGAWDPELDRLVAIKLVKAEMQGVRDRILLEGQALAKVSHPNIVPVFDVGVVDEQVYLVMEWVRGKNLRAYCKQPRSVADILAIYRSAGEGLVAAHAAGIIHRDFKPDNAIRGDDGRVRILDFGLARGEVRAVGADARTPKPPSSPDDKQRFSQSSDLTRGAGTPRYMPPEQAEGKQLTPAVDQYAFCVSLREALVERHADDKKAADVPKWIDEILTKGTAREAANRYDSMEALLRALTQDPAIVRRRRLLLAGGVAVAGATFAVGMFAGGGDNPAVERCAGGKDEIAKSWNASVRDKLQTHLKSLGPYGVTEATRLAQSLEDYTNRWAVAHRTACLTKERGELTPQLYERNLGCLARTRVALETAVEVSSKATTVTLPNAVLATGGLPSAERCLTETQTSNVEPPPPEIAAQVAELSNQVERARVLGRAQTPDAVAFAEDVAKRAEPLAYAPIAARAHLAHGMALLARDTREPAAAILARATKSAFRANEDALAIESYAQQIYALATSDPKQLPSDALESLGAIDISEGIASRLGATGSFARFLLQNNIGIVKLTRGDRAGARHYFEAARNLRNQISEARPETYVVWVNLSNVEDEPSQQAQLLSNAVTELQSQLGPDHPDVLNVRVAAGMLARDPQLSSDGLRAPCERFQTLHSHLVEKVSQCGYEIAYLQAELGDRPQASRWMELVAKNSPAAVAEQTPEQQIARAYIDGTLVTLANQLLVNETSFFKLRGVDAVVLAARNDALGAEKTVLLSRSLATLEGLAFWKALPIYQRRLARIRALLAEVSPPETAKSLAKEALGWYRSTSGYDDMVEQLEKVAN